MTALQTISAVFERVQEQEHNMKDHLERAAELIEQALDEELKHKRSSRLYSATEIADVKKAAAERFAQLAQIERGHDVEVGPYDGHPVDCETGHGEGCARHAADIARYEVWRDDE